MPAGTKTIKTRIRSIKNTAKITKAVELVSATKMRRATKATLASRPYALAAAETAAALAAARESGESVFFTPKKGVNPATGGVKKVAVVLFSSNRALCGSFNVQVVAAAKKGLAARYANNMPEVSWITVGKQGTSLLSKMGEVIVANFLKAETAEEAEEFFTIGKMLTKEFLAGTYDEVLIAYTDFVSVLKQAPQLKPILPIGQSLLGERVGGAATDFTFEPSREVVLSYLVPRFIEVELYQALLESNASEHSARMMTMKNASDAAGELVDDLVLLSNQLRQAMITREIAEIAGGKAALTVDE